MTDNVKTSPKFDGLNFPIWKVNMAIFLQFLEICVAKAITKPFVIPEGDEDLWSDITVKKFEAMPKPVMPCYKLLTMMIFLRSLIASPHMIFEIIL